MTCNTSFIVNVFPGATQEGCLGMISPVLLFTSHTCLTLGSALCRVTICPLYFQDASSFLKNESRTGSLKCQKRPGNTTAMVFSDSRAYFQQQHVLLHCTHTRTD